MANVSSSNSHKELSPRLRFPEFEEEWKTQKLRDFTERITRKNSDNQTQLPLTISSKDGLVDQVTYFNKQVSSKDMSGYYLLKNGEFAYNKSYSVGYDFGSIKRLDRYPMGALSTLYICFALTKHNSDFMKVYFDSLKWYKEIYMIAAEGTRNHGLLNVPTDDFFDTLHILPQNPNEQDKIAKFLILVEKRIEKQQALVDNLKSYKRGFLHDIFTQKIKITYEENWTEISLGEIAKIYQPQTISTDQLNENFPYPVYGANGLIGYYSRFNHDTEQIAICCRGASCGTVNYIPAKSWITGNAMVINIQSKEVDKKFIYYQLLASDLSYMISGSGQPQIVRKPCEEHKILLPSFNTQIAISNLCNKIDLNINANSVILEKMIETKSALLQRLFI